MVKKYEAITLLLIKLKLKNNFIVSIAQKFHNFRIRDCQCHLEQKHINGYDGQC